jgi:DNA polymerase III subunit gamma/tau
MKSEFRSLANKYRPEIFDEVIDQSHIIDILKYQVEHAQTSSTYLFCGPRGTGKTSTARILSKAVNCMQPNKWNPCNMCENCLIIKNNKSLDFVEIDAATYTGVDNIRDVIISKSWYPPMWLKKKIYLIDEVHMLSKGAFSSLLKIMEEPPEYMIFILATTEIDKVPNTVLSRCQIFNFTKIISVDMIGHLVSICTKEWFTYEMEALELIENISDGYLRDAIKYLDQVSLWWSISVQNVMKYIWVASTTMISDFLQSVQWRDFEIILSKIQLLNQNGIEITNFTKQVLHYIDIHYTDNISMMSQLALLFETILIHQKTYSNPILAYKVELRNYIQQYNRINHIEAPSANTTNHNIISKDTSIESSLEDIQYLKNSTNITQQEIDQNAIHVSIDSWNNTSIISPQMLSETIQNVNLNDIHHKLYQATKESLQKMIGQAGKFIYFNNTIQLILTDHSKITMIRRPDIIKYFEELIVSILGQAYVFDIVYCDPQNILDQNI